MRPLSAQSNKFKRVRGVPLLKTGGATSLINAGKSQYFVSPFNSSLAVCSSLNRSCNFQTNKAMNIKQVDLIAAYHSNQENNGAKNIEDCQSKTVQHSHAKGTSEKNTAKNQT
jgi:hypothetical protein